MASPRSSKSSNSSGHILVGVVKRPVGLRGDVEVAPDSDDPRRFAAGSQLYAGPDLQPLRITGSRTHGDRTIVVFGGVEDRTGAEALQGLELFVTRDDVRDLDEGEFWDFDLIGCDAFAPDGSTLGRVSGVIHPPGNDVLVIERQGREHLVPLVGALVPEVDIEGRRIVVDPIPGLLE